MKQKLFSFRELSNILNVVFPKTFKIRVAIFYSWKCWLYRIICDFRQMLFYFVNILHITKIEIAPLFSKHKGQIDGLIHVEI